MPETIRALLILDSALESFTWREMMAQLPATGVTLQMVTTLHQARQYLRETPYDVLLLDLSLAGRMGLEDFMRGCRGALQVPIVALVDADREQLGQQALHEGAYDFLVKGHIDHEHVLRSVRYTVERHRLLADQQRLKEDLQVQTVVDEVAGVYSRHAFLTFGQHLLRVADRLKVSMQLVLAEIDGLPAIAETHGHHMADLVVLDTAAILKETFRQSDVVGRLGDGEFGVLAVAAALSSGETLAARLQIQLRAHAARGHRPYRLSLNVGTAAYTPEAPCTFAGLLAQAQEARARQMRGRTAA